MKCVVTGEKVANHINIIELFGGIGSFIKALKNIGLPVNVLDYVENDPITVQAYNQLHDANEIPRDIKQYTYTQTHKVDVLTGGFPCQDISSAGKQNLKTGRSLLYREIIRILKTMNPQLRPDYIIIENVKTILQKKFNGIIQELIDEISPLGYQYESKILNAIDFSIPQTRQRYFLIFSKSGGIFDWLSLKIPLKLKSLSTFLENYQTVDKSKWFTNKKLQIAVDKGYYKEQEWKVSTNNSLYIPLTKWTSDNQFSLNGVHVLRKSCQLVKTLIPLQYQFYQNYLQLPRSSDGLAKAVDKANGNYNRYWLHNKIVGSLNTTVIIPIAINVFNNNGRMLIPHFNFRQTDMVTHYNSGITPTLLNNHGIQAKVALNNINNIVEFALLNDIAMFKIENRLYIIRYLTANEFMLLMGWDQLTINKLKISQSKIYKIAGNGIVIPVLEMIFKAIYRKELE